MTEDISFDNHFSLESNNKEKLDLNHQAPKEVKDAVWEIINGRTPKEPDLPPDRMLVEVPVEYVNAVAWAASRRLERMGCTKNFYVEINKTLPLVYLRFERFIVIPGHPPFEKTTINCLAAYMALRHQKKEDFLPEKVGERAAMDFIEWLNKVHIH